MVFSSTLPNIFDGSEIAKQKWLQIKNGEGKSVSVAGSMEFSNPQDEVFDTKPITLEKLVQKMAPPVLPGGGAVYAPTGLILGAHLANTTLSWNYGTDPDIFEFEIRDGTVNGALLDSGDLAGSLRSYTAAAFCPTGSGSLYARIRGKVGADVSAFAEVTAFCD